MPRFYRTASANPLDYSYRQNTPLMERVLKQNEQYIDQSLQQAGTLGNAAANINYLQQDETRAKEIIDSYSKEVESLTDAIRKDPTNWRKQQDPMRQLGNKLQNDFKAGEISKIAGNFRRYKDASDYIDKQVESYNSGKGGISASEGNAYKNYFLSNFKGTGYKDGQYETIQAYNPGQTIDLPKKLGEEMEKIKADKTKYKRSDVTGEEMYFNDVTKEYEAVTPDRILQIAMSRLASPDVMHYLQDRQKIGSIQNAVDANGNLLPIYARVPIAASDDEKSNMNRMSEMIKATKDPRLKEEYKQNLKDYSAQIEARSALAYNPNSSLSPTLQGLVAQYAHSSKTEEQNLRANPVGTTKLVQQESNKRTFATIAGAKERTLITTKAANDRFKDRLDFDKDKFEWEKDFKNKELAEKYKPKDATGKPITAKAGESAIPLPTTVSKLPTNPFETWTTTDIGTGKTIPVLSNAGINSDIVNKKKEYADKQKQISDYDKQLKFILGNRDTTQLQGPELGEYNNILTKKRDLELVLPEIQDDLNQRRYFYNMAEQAALTDDESATGGVQANKLSPREKELLKKYEKDKTASALTKMIDENSQNYMFPSMNTGGYGSSVTEWAHRKLEQGLIPDLTPGGMIKDQASAALRKALGNTELRKEYTEYINARSKLFANKDRFLANVRKDVIDTDAIQVGDADKPLVANMVFANTQGMDLYNIDGKKETNFNISGHSIPLVGTQLSQFLVENPGIKPVVEMIGNTTKLGKGNALAKVSFQDAKGKSASRGYFIELTPEVQDDLVTLFSRSKDPEVLKLAGKIGDDEANDIRRQLIQPSVVKTSGGQTSEAEPVEFSMFLNQGDQRLELKVNKYVNKQGENNLYMKYKDAKTGEWTPLQLSPTQPKGQFKNAEEFIELYRASK